MDVCAIMNADDELLKDMGLLKAGDRLSLRGFCRSHSQSEKKEDFLKPFLKKRKERKQALLKNSPEEATLPR